MQVVKGNDIELVTRHPNRWEVDIDDIKELVASGIRTTPHVGNLDNIQDPYPDEQAVYVGAQTLPRNNSHRRSYVTLALVGVRIECVDTITVDDIKYRPGIILKNDRETALIDISARDKKSYVPAAIQPVISGSSLETIHMTALQSFAPGAITRTTFYNELGTRQNYSKGEVYHALIVAIEGLVRIARNGKVSISAKQRVHSKETDEYGIFGNGSDPLSGVMPSIEMALAAEVVEAVLEGKDEVHHIGGSDMYRYTQQLVLMKSVAIIAEKAMRMVGIKIPKAITFVTYNKYTGIAGLPELSKKIGTEIGLAHYSQHDLRANRTLIDRARKLAS